MKHSEGEATKIEMLYRQHGPALVLYATAIAGERSRAQDAVHEMFMRLMEQGINERVLDMKAYLFTCVRNRLRNETKRLQRNVELGPDLGWFVPPERDFAAERNLRNALLALPEEQREITVMHIWGELTFRQIADVLEVSANTVSSRYRCALASLRKAFHTKECSHDYS